MPSKSEESDDEVDDLVELEDNVDNEGADNTGDDDVGFETAKSSNADAASDVAVTKAVSDLGTGAISGTSKPHNLNIDRTTFSAPKFVVSFCAERGGIITLAFFTSPFQMRISLFWKVYACE